MGKLGAMIGDKTGFVVSVRPAPVGMAAVDAFESTVDIGIPPLFESLLAYQRNGAEALLQLMRGRLVVGMRGAIVTRAGRSLDAASELAGRRVV